MTTVLPQTNQPKLVSQSQAAEILGVSPRSLETWRIRGGGPAFIKIGRAVRYDPDDLRAYIDQHRIANTAQEVSNG